MNTTPLRSAEIDSIRAFVQRAADHGYLDGHVLDYGAGEQPYRAIVEARRGTYTPFDRMDFPASKAPQDLGPGNALAFGYDAILCTQVVQYLPRPEIQLRDMQRALWRNGGHLVLTYPTNWPEVEAEDLHRWTKAGMERLMQETGFNVVAHERRASIEYQGNFLAHGYGLIARAER